MKWLDILWGHGSDLNSLQMADRAFVTFFVALLLLRIAGVRTFGKKTAFDNVIIIMLGSVLSRAVVGASPFIPTATACFVFVLIHWLLAKLSFHFDWIGRLVKGERVVLFEAGKKNTQNMQKTNISEKDIMEGVRTNAHSDQLQNIKEIAIERNGEISVIPSQL